jgi:hypothetical protein
MDEMSWPRSVHKTGRVMLGRELPWSGCDEGRVRN